MYFTGFIVTFFTMHGIGHWQHWDERTIFMGKLYGLIVLFNFTGIPMGVLRLFGLFKLFATRRLASSVIKLVGVSIAFILKADILGFLAVWIVSEIFGSIVLISSAWLELRKRKLWPIFSEPLKGIVKNNKGIWGFLISTNLTGSFKVGFKELDVLIIAKLLTLSDVGLFKMAKKFSAILRQATNPLYQVIYPEIAKLWAKGQTTKLIKLAKNACLAMGLVAFGACVVFIILGKPLLLATAGKDFLPAYPITLWYMVAEAIALTLLPLAPIIISMGRPGLNLTVQIATSVIYFPLLFLFINHFSLVGAGMAYFIHVLTKDALLFFMVNKYFRRHLAQRTHEEAVVMKSLMPDATEVA